MYNSTDITNILNSTKDCPKSIVCKICCDLKKGKLKYNLQNVNIYQDIEYLLKKEQSSSLVNCMIDIIQDICDNCDISSSTTTTTVETDCGDDAIITEDGLCIISETGDNIIQE